LRPNVAQVGSGRAGGRRALPAESSPGRLGLLYVENKQAYVRPEHGYAWICAWGACSAPVRILSVHLLKGLSCEGVRAIEFPAPFPMLVQEETGHWWEPGICGWSACSGPVHPSVIPRAGRSHRPSGGAARSVFGTLHDPGHLVRRAVERLPECGPLVRMGWDTDRPLTFPPRPADRRSSLRQAP
jgi:hypothetical protein